METNLQLPSLTVFSKTSLHTMLIGMLVISCFCPVNAQPLQTKQKNASHSYSHVGQPLSKIYTAKQHGGHNQNWTSIQSADGLVYVGHTEGVSQWDGKQWFNFSTPHSTPVRSITQFEGTLYFGTTNDLFSLYVDHAGELKAESLLTQQLLLNDDFGEIWSTASNDDGVVFVAANHTFFFDGQHLRELPNAVSSKHAIFNIDGNFYYKPRHLSNISKLSTVKTSKGFEYSYVETQISLPEEARVMEIISDVDRNLIIFTERHGVFKASNDDVVQVLGPETFAKDIQIYDAILSSDGFYYVSSTYSGLFILDSHLNIVRHYLENDGISMNTVFSVNEDMQGNIWLTGIPNIVKMRPAHIISQFKAGNTSTEILRLKQTPLGIFATGNGQYVLNVPKNKTMTPSFEAMSSSNESSVDLMQVDDVLLKSGRGGVFELSLNEDASVIVTENKLLDAALGRPLIRDNNGYIIASSSDGAFLLKRQSKAWEVDVFTPSLGPLISITRDKNDTLWLGSPTSELFKLDNISRDGTEATVEILTAKDGLGLGPVNIFNIDGNAIFSSAGLLFIYADGKLQDASKMKSVLPIFEEAWLADSEVIDPLIQSFKTETSPERVWYRKNGRSGYFEKQSEQQWQESTVVFDAVEAGGFNDLFVTDGGILWFVRDKAEIYRVDIASAEKLPQLAPVNIRRIESNNNAIPFTLDMDEVPQLEPEQSDIRFTYALADSSSPAAIEYRTRLGKNQGGPWSSWSQEAYRDFTQLSPGHYTFDVEAVDAWQRKSAASVSFIIAAPWYFTPAAYFIYVVLCFISLFLFAYVVQKWRTRALEAANLVLEQKVEARTKEVNEKVELLRQQQLLKDRFFSNVSHEFRTPLTLTIGPLETLMKEHSAALSQPIAHLAKTALNNASKMLALVGQVLDLNRLEAGKLPLRVAQYDIAELLRNISERFETWAGQHHQEIQVVDCAEPLLLWFDMDQFDKCVSNLLSNAIKYSGENTTIQVQLVNHDTFAEVYVRDNGKGISEGAKSKVFERFYQDKSSENVSEPGTGIGLALVKEIMEIHHGEAKLLDSNAANNVNSERGCCFVLMLKSGNQHFASEQIIEPIDVASLTLRKGAQVDYLPLKRAEVESLPNSLSGDKDVTTLLIVDDNKELLNFISLRLSASYRIIQASNGQEGYKKACKELPDLIISDVNMPLMTGLELAQQIKENKLTQTIPIILLTAKATKREVVAGFSVGADDYLTKPFDTSELIMRVNAQINVRKLVREKSAAKQAIDTQKIGPVSLQDKINIVIEEQLAEPSFNVEKLAALMHMSRDTLIRKCKKECGDTPLNLIVQMRMQKADELLKQQIMSVSEVAYACGFESLAYFSNRYKKHRGISPSEVSP